MGTNLIDTVERRLREVGSLDHQHFKTSRRGLLTLAAFGVGSTALQAQDTESIGLYRKHSANVRLLDRITFGLTEAEMQRIAFMGYDGYLEYQLNPAAIDDSGLDARLANYTTLNMEPYQLYSQGTLPLNELTQATILRSVLSNRQLYQRMVEFWTDHFNIDIKKEDCQYIKTVDDREVIRQYAMATFPQLLSASAHSGAMMVYLDNSMSSGTNPNQNYARELMELHTLGSGGGGYTQTDVQEVARCLTGWGIAGSQQGNLHGRFYYNAARHDTGTKVVLGNTIVNGGQQDGETVLQILSSHPACAQFIATKLCKFFWGYQPPQSLIDAVTQSYIGTGGDIKSMLRVILNKQTLMQGGLKFKRPYHLVCNVMRTLNATNTSLTTLVNNQLRGVGQVPFQWGPLTVIRTTWTIGWEASCRAGTLVFPL